MPARFLLLLLVAFPAAGGDAIRIVHPAAGTTVAGERVIDVETAATKFERIEIRVDGALAGVLRERPLRLLFDFGDGTRARRITADLYTDGYRNHARAEIATAPIDAGAAITIDWVEVPVEIRGWIDPEPSSFRVFENGGEHRVREVTPGRLPARFVFLIDRSQSMSDGRLEAAVAAVKNVIGRLRTGDSAEIVLFNHRVGRPIDAAEIGAIDASGGTALRDALATIDPDSRTIAIVISDGNDRNSLLDRETAIHRVAVDDLTVHALVLGRGDGTSFLRDVAARTGGSLAATTARRLTVSLEHLFDAIDGRWTIAYQSAGGASGWRAIRVETTARGASVSSARTGYFAE
ncbi:MAG: vWA domain-containing protein [Thermoanaerobaculia bacterium]